MDPTQIIKSKTRRILVGHVLIPKLKNLKERQQDGQDYIGKKDLFSVGQHTRTSKSKAGSPQAASLSPPPATMVNWSVDGETNASPTNGSPASQVVVDDGSIEMNQDTDYVWDLILELVESGSLEEEARPFYDQRDAVKGFELSARDRQVLIGGLLYLCKTVSPSPVITDSQKDDLFFIVAKYADSHTAKGVSRSRFIQLVKKFLSENELSDLRYLDLAEYALYLFPEGSGKIEADTVVDFINSSTSPSEHHCFAASYVRNKASERMDFVDFLFYIPFVFLYLWIVGNGKGLFPLAYYSHNINSAMGMVLYTSEFTPGCARTPNGLGGVTNMCGNDDDITYSDISSPRDWYDFAHGPLLNGLWGDTGNERASSRSLQNTIKVTGALKIRQIRQTGAASSDYEKFFGFKGAPEKLRSDRGRTGRRYQPSDGSQTLDTGTYPFVNYSALVSPVVSPEGTDLNGFHYIDCDEGNATEAIAGDMHRYNCDGHTLIIPFNHTRNEAASMLHQLEVNKWIDVQTTAVIIDFFAIHPASGFVLGERMLAEFHPAGAATTLYQNHPFAFYTTSTNSVTSQWFWMVFVCYLGLLWLRLLWRIGTSIARCTGERRPGSNALDGIPWVVFDFFTYNLFVLHTVYRLRWMWFGSPREDPVYQVDHYPKGYEQVAWDWNVLNHIDAINVVLIVLSVLRYTKYVPGLDLVINTLQKSVRDCLSVFIVFIGTYLSFVITGWAVWGDVLENYRNFHTTFLTLSVINEVGFRDIHNEHPQFTYMFFVFYHLIMVACLLNMIIAVFSEAYNEVKAATFQPEEVTSIFDNNPRRALTRESNNFWNGFHLTQFALSWGTRLCGHAKSEEMDEYDFAGYYVTMRDDLRVLLVPSEKLAHPDDDDSKECYQLRVKAATALTKLMEDWIPEMESARTVEIQSRNIYQYCQGLFQEMDYNLIFALFVLVPQNKFDLKGRSLLLDACNSFTKWNCAVQTITHESTDSDKLQVKLECTLLHELADDHAVATEAEDEDNGPAECLGGPDALFGLGSHARLIVYGLVSNAQARREQLLTKQLFTELYDDPRCNYAKELDGMDAEEMWDLVGLDKISKGREYVLADIRTQMQEFFAVRTYSFLWSPHEIRRLAAWIKDHDPRGIKEVAGAANVDLDAQDDSQPPTLRSQPQDDLKTGMMVKREQFEEAWEAAKLSSVPAATLERVFSTSDADGEISMTKFVRYCNANPRAHFRQDFGSFYATSQAEAAKYGILLSNYVPFLALILFFMLHGSQLGESIHITRGLRNHFDIREAGLTDFSGIQSYVTDTILPGIWSGAPDELAGTLNNVNFFVGAMRIRQRRVRSRGTLKCSRNYENFFGPFEKAADGTNTATLTYPSYFDDVTKAFYDQRVAEDYSDLQKAECFGAYDYGVENDRDAFGPAATGENQTYFASLDPAVQTAFTFQDDGQYGGSDVFEAHDSEYDEGGYMLILPFNLTRNEAESKVAEMFAHRWMDNQTRVFVVEFVLFNYNLKLYAKARFGIEITGGGGFWPLDEIGVSSASAAVDTPFLIFVAAVFWILFLCFIVQWVSSVAGNITKVRQYLGYSFLGGLWHSFRYSAIRTVDLIIILMTLSSWCLRLVNSASLGINTVRNDGEYPNNIGLAIQAVQNIRKAECVLIIMAFQRTFYFVRFIRRLQIIFITLAKAAGDLFSIMFLFLVAIVAFSLSGVVLYGFQLQQFYNVQNAFLSLFLHVMGENDFEDMVPARPLTTPIFSHAMSILCSFVLFNLVVGVLTDTYGAVKNSMWDSTSAHAALSKHERDEERREGEDAPGSQHVHSKAKPTVGTRIKWFFLENVISMEIRYIKDYICHCGKLPLELKMRNRRKMWELLANWQRSIDSGQPRDAVVGAARMLLVNSMSSPTVNANGELGDPDAIVAEPSLFGRNADATDYFTADKFKARPRRRLRTYGAGRLPLWEEFLHDRVGPEVKHTLQCYYIQPSTHFVESLDQHHLWLDALETYYYYSQTRELYTGKGTSSSEMALHGIRQSLENAAQQKNKAQVALRTTKEKIAVQSIPVPPMDGTEIVLADDTEIVLAEVEDDVGDNTELLEY